ncbi:hypothetical protein PHISCL_02380 [Aspergillus sclerotialis]|uniref:Uncharacterized protein n=1 Tax=Aspergillus sclerotialis TaxID=2070753 RepID=A0A3A3A7G0_9EURO|nr:hypothetical protein PHISCL_02380 [Aspergillus sclerotialis]
MLLNLGLTADAAAAHGNEFADSSQVSQSSNPKPNPSVVSFAKSPLLGLGSFYNSFKGSEPPEPQNKQNSSMPTSNIDSRSSSDGDFSVVESTIAPRPTRSIPKKQTSRPKTSYHLAHPAGHARHKRLKLRPKLLLQLQQSSHTSRPLPILDVLPSSVYLPKLTRKFPTIFRGKNGLGPNDLIIVTSELYENDSDKASKHKGEKKDDEHQEVIATICQLLTEDALSKGKAEICLNYGPVWEATPLPNGSYEFVADTDNGRQIMRWVQRPNKNRRVSGSTIGTIPQEETKRFTFSVINPNTRRHPVVASMIRNRLEVFDEYSTPSSVSKPPTSSMSMVSDDSQVDDRNMVPMDDKLRTLIIITSIWVAFREGWSHNFTYDDSASALNSKAICSPMSSKHNSPTTVTAENDVSPEDNGRHPNVVTTNGSRHIAFANRQSHTAPVMDVSKATSSGKLNKRSNSTGANFLKRSNRQTARPSRHSMLPQTKDNHDITPNSVQPEDEYFSIGAGNGNNKHAKGPDRAVDTHAEVVRGTTNGTTNSRVPETNGVKPKRRHRFSNILDLFSKRH